MYLIIRFMYFNTYIYNNCSKPNFWAYYLIYKKSNEINYMINNDSRHDDNNNIIVIKRICA